VRRKWGRERREREERKQERRSGIRDSSTISCDKVEIDAMDDLRFDGGRQKPW